MMRQSYKPWIPDSKDTGALEGAVALPCQGEYIFLPYALQFLMVEFRPQGAVEPRTDVLPELDPAVLPGQPSLAKLLP